MLVIAQAGTGALLSTTVSTTPVNLRAYAIALADGTTEVVLVNKDLSSAARVVVDLGAAVSAAKAAYLLGPSAAATTGMTFAGSEVGVTGTWTPDTVYVVPVNGGELTVTMPAVSAALVRAR
jgi:hypothetical protein